MKTLVIGTIAAACLAIAAPTFAAPKADKPNRQKHQQTDNTERGEKLFQKIESKLGHELTADQKQQIQQTTRSTMQNLRPLQETFIKSVADAVKLSPDEVKQAIKPQPGQGKNKVKGASPEERITAALETHLNRKLTDEETKAIASAADARKDAAKPIQEDYVSSLAKITGMSVDDVKSVLPKKFEA